MALLFMNIVCNLIGKGGIPAQHFAVLHGAIQAEELLQLLQHQGKVIMSSTVQHSRIGCQSLDGYSCAET